MLMLLLGLATIVGGVACMFDYGGMATGYVEMINKVSQPIQNPLRKIPPWKWLFAWRERNIERYRSHQELTTRYAGGGLFIIIGVIVVIYSVKQG